PSFSVYADENENENGVINIEKDLLKGNQENSNFSFMASFDDGLSIIDYKKMVDDDPLNIVLLKNYAHHLQSNGDLNGAEEYYFRATQADHKDGETLMQYARLVWELHHDQDRALGYFKAAVLASPEDCVLV
nr:putative acetyltransferase A, auxiliary subunit [Tanacetum cinerariifolium]